MFVPNFKSVIFNCPAPRLPVTLTYLVLICGQMVLPMVFRVWIVKILLVVLIKIITAATYCLKIHAYFPTAR